MSEQNFTLQQVKGFLKDEFDLEWDYIYYDNVVQSYSRVLLEDFRTLDSLDLLVRKGEKQFLQRVLVNNTNFGVFYDNGRGVYNYGSEWQAYVKNENNKLREKEQGLNK